MSMFAAMPQHTYAYGAPATSTRQYSAQGTSSAFSSSALPDEDWTKISDLAERRRIQNRIAQRNYRKKLKRRLEDLERRAGSSDDGEPDQKPQTVSASTTTVSRNKRQSIQKTRKSSPPASAPAPAPAQAPAAPVAKQMLVPQHGQFTPPMDTSEEMVFASVFDNRERSLTPPMFAYPSYSSADDPLMDPYASAQPYPSISDADYPAFFASTAMPSMTGMGHFGDAIKSCDDSLNPYMNYTFVSGVDVNMTGHYDSSNVHTPPLSHTYGTSTTCSEAGYEYPTTPLSMPGSPGLIHNPQ